MIEQGYEISTDKTRLDLELIHDFLANRSYWAAGVPYSVVVKSIENSLCFGVYDQGGQVGFGRVVTDFATFAYIGDVFILEHYRGRGLGQKLIKAIMECPELQGLRLWLIGTKDAHDLYRKFGFQKVVETPFVDRFMVIRKLDVYQKGSSS